MHYLIFPKKFKTVNLFKAALTHNNPSQILQSLNDYTNEASLTEDEYKIIIKEIVEKCSTTDLIRSFIYDRQLEVLLALIKSNKADLESILNETKYRVEFTNTELKALYSASVGSQPLSIMHVPPNMRDLEMCQSAVKDDFRAIIHVPDILLERGEFKEAGEKWRAEIAKNAKLIEKTPAILLNQDTCITAAQSNIDALKHIPKKYHSYKLFKAALNNARSADILSFLRNYKHETTLTDEEYKNIFKETVEKNNVYSLISHTPHEMLLEVALECIRQKSGYELSHILSGNKLTALALREVQLAAVDKDVLIKYIQKIRVILNILEGLGKCRGVWVY